MGWACGTYWRQARCIHSLVGRPERKRPLEGPGFIREDNIKNGTIIF